MRRRRKYACPTVIAAVETTVPSTMPPMPIGPYSAAETAALINSVTPASAVGVHGFWSEKNVRVSSRLNPEKGSEKENQNSASETRRVDSASKSPRWYTSRVIGSDSAIVTAAEGISSSAIWRMPLAWVARRPSQSCRATSRESAGNSTVATATENMPCGSM